MHHTTPHTHTQLLESELDEAYRTHEAQSLELASMRKTCTELAQQRTQVETQRAGALKVWLSTSIFPSLHYNRIWSIFFHKGSRLYVFP